MSRERLTALLALIAIALVLGSYVGLGRDDRPPCPQRSVAAGDWAGSIDKGLEMAALDCEP